MACFAVPFDMMVIYFGYLFWKVIVMFMRLLAVGSAGW
jgi:hypothetical protein